MSNYQRHMPNEKYVDRYLLTYDAFYLEATPQSILMIEDNKSDVHYLTIHIQKIFGRDAFMFHDAPRMIEAFDIIDRHPIDLVFLDLDLLDIEGSSTIAALHAEAPNIPIIVYSGSDAPRLRSEALQCGALDYMVKGNENDLLITRSVENALTVYQH